MSNGITFSVDDVTPATDRLPPLEPDALERLLGGPPLAMGMSRGEVVSASEGMPALVEAVHLAFASHRPLVLTPDAIWLTLASGLAIHLRENSERLGARLVRHQGKKTLHVDAGDASNWPAIIEMFGGAIAKDTGPGIVNLFTCSFSTTQPIDRTAGQILLMEAMKRHYDYEVGCICGIPTITLAGTPDDWRDIKRRVLVMSELDLSWWTSMLMPLCDRFIDTAEGRVDRAFWQAMYKPQAAYGAEVITGWLVRLFPYLGEKEPTPNDFAALAPEGIVSRNDERYWEEQAAQYTASAKRRTDWLEKGIFPTPKCAPDHFVHAPISPGSFPVGRTRVEVRVRGPVDDTVVELVGGLLGVVQEENGLALAPASGWVVRDCPLETLGERIRARHRAVPLGSESRSVSAFVRDETLSWASRQFHEIGFFGDRVILWGDSRYAYVRERVKKKDSQRYDLGPVRIGMVGDDELWAEVDDDVMPPTWRATISIAPRDGSEPRVIARSALELLQRLSDPDAKEPYFLTPSR